MLFHQKKRQDKNKQKVQRFKWNCWWKKSYTQWDVYPVENNGINYLSTGAGFLPSTERLSKNKLLQPHYPTDNINLGDEHIESNYPSGVFSGSLEKVFQENVGNLTT